MGGCRRLPLTLPLLENEDTIELVENMRKSSDLTGREKTTTVISQCWGERGERNLIICSIRSSVLVNVCFT